MPGQLLYHFRACIVGDKLIVTGGSTSLVVGGATCKVTNAVWEYSFTRREWKDLKRMLKGRALHSMVAVGDEVYVMGGAANSPQNTPSITDTAEKLSLSSGAWKMLAPLEEPLCRHLGVSVQDTVYIMGGGGEKDSSLATWRYDTDGDSWQRKANMPYACDRGCCAVVSDHVYVVGEYAQNIMSYDPCRNAWSTLTPPKLQSMYPCAAAWRGTMLLGAGRADRDTDQWFSDIERYDPSTDEWSKWEPSFPNQLKVQCMLYAQSLL